jgi:hypothetical protein
LDRAFEQDSSALRRSAQAVERAAERLEKTAEELGSLRGGDGAERDEALDERLSAFEEGLTETLVDVTADLFGDFKLGLEDLFSGLFSRFVTSRLGLFGDLLELFLPFAGGGLVRSPTLALLGESGPEYVIPEPSVHRALEGGLAGVLDLLAEVRGGASAAGGEWGAPAGTTISTSIIHQHYAPAVGSLDKLDDYSQVAGAGVSGGNY